MSRVYDVLRVGAMPRVYDVLRVGAMPRVYDVACDGLVHVQCIRLA